MKIWDTQKKRPFVNFSQGHEDREDEDGRIVVVFDLQRNADRGNAPFDSFDYDSSVVSVRCRKAAQ